MTMARCRTLGALVAAAAFTASFALHGDALAATQADATPETAVSEGAPLGEGTVRALTPFRGSGRLADSEGVSTQELGELEMAPATPENSGVTESIIGPDQRWWVNPTTTYPARATVRITSSVGSCTGWLYDDDTVATAGHCLHDGSWANVSGIRVSPGQNGPTNRPYGSCGARSIHSVLGWVNDKNSEYDYGAIKLNCTIGRTVGWYGMRWQTASLDGTTSWNRGYGFDKNSQQWMSVGTVKRSADRKLYYTNDTVNGNSGGPVYAYFPFGGPYGIAVHTNGTADGETNSGRRITSAAFANYQAWGV